MAGKAESVGNPVDVEVGARIRVLRKMKGLSQQAVADAVGVSFQQIQKYERGGNRVSASMLARIAGVLGISASELFGEGSANVGALDQVANLLGLPGAVDLLKAYSRMPPGPQRPALIQFVAAISGEASAVS